MQKLAGIIPFALHFTNDLILISYACKDFYGSLSDTIMPRVLLIIRCVDITG